MPVSRAQSGRAYTELSSHYSTARNRNDTFFGGLHITAGNSNPTEYPSNELSSYE